jgi:hypothetical protein
VGSVDTKKVCALRVESEGGRAKEHLKGKGAIQRERRNTFPGQNNR